MLVTFRCKKKSIQVKTNKQTNKLKEEKIILLKLDEIGEILRLKLIQDEIFKL